MRRVEDPPRGVVEPAQEERETNGHIRHVRERDEQDAIRLQEPAEKAERPPRLLEVLEDVPRHDDVEGGLAERRERPEEVSRETAVEEVRRSAGGVFVQLDPGEEVAPPPDPARQLARPEADVEEPEARASRLDLPEQDLVGRAGNRLPGVARGGRGGAQAGDLWVIGILRPVPKAFIETLSPGAACARLYSARSS